jgi:hypothetical protein
LIYADPFLIIESQTFNIPNPRPAWLAGRSVYQLKNILEGNRGLSPVTPLLDATVANNHRDGRDAVWQTPGQDSFGHADKKRGLSRSLFRVESAG